MSSTLHKELIKQGNGHDKPKKGDEVTIEYTGWLYDANAAQHRGKQWAPHGTDQCLLAVADRLSRFDSSKNRGDFKTAIGVGRVIKGIRVSPRTFKTNTLTTPLF